MAVLNGVLLAAGFALAVTRLGEGSGPGPTGSGGPVAAGGGSGGAPAGIDPLAEIPVPGGTTGLAARRSAGAGEVADRPWPARVAAPGPWTATLAGKGDRIEITAPGTIVAGLDGASVALGSADPRPASGREAPTSNRYLALPDGSRWYAVGRIRLEGSGDVAFSTLVTSGREVSATVASFEALIGSAQGGLTGVGSFVHLDGRTVDRLVLPPGTRHSAECRQTSPTTTPCQPPGPQPLPVQIAAAPGLSIRAAGAGEAAVAGAARATALGRTWQGLVAAVEAQQLRAAASYADDRWTLAADGGGARQVWVDVWPVIDTRLAATARRGQGGFFDALKGDTYAVGIQWTNVGFATSQILEAEGVGPGAQGVGFDLNKTSGHSAGLKVARGDRVVNMRGGADIDSNLAPGESVERGLSAPQGSSATIVLRGNFPEVRVPLAIPQA